jgi:hypothetical protein
VIGSDPTLEVDGEEQAALGIWLATHGVPIAPTRGSDAPLAGNVISLAKGPVPG